MGTNTLTQRIDGDEIPAADHNELVEAFVGNIVPRNSSRVATDIAGSLGTSGLRFLRAFVTEYFIGDAGNNLKVYEGSPDEIWIERDSATGEQIRISNDKIAFYFGGNEIASFSSTTFSSLERYIPTTSIDTANIVHGLISFGENTNYQTLFNRSIAGTANKRFLIQINTFLTDSTIVNAPTDYQILLNGNVVVSRQDFPDQTQATAGTAGITEVISIPTTQTHTIRFDIRDCAWSDGTYFIMEV